MVDTYGGYIPHRGGASSGKDASKVDRSASYMARYLAQNICVYAGLAEHCLVQLSYAMGIPDPTSFYIYTFGTKIVEQDSIIKFIKNNIDLSSRGIIEQLSLT